MVPEEKRYLKLTSDVCIWALKFGTCQFSLLFIKCHRPWFVHHSGSVVKHKIRAIGKSVSFEGLFPGLWPSPRVTEEASKPWSLFYKNSDTLELATL